jgi:hypothetical protein
MARMAHTAPAWYPGIRKKEESCAMTALKCLVAATALLLSAQVTAACDDFDEEMAMAAAYEATKLAQAAEQATSQQATAPLAGALPDVASIDSPMAATAQQ